MSVNLLWYIVISVLFVAENPTPKKNHDFRYPWCWSVSSKRTPSTQNTIFSDISKHYPMAKRVFFFKYIYRHWILKSLKMVFIQILSTCNPSDAIAPNIIMQVERLITNFNFNFFVACMREDSHDNFMLTSS